MERKIVKKNVHLECRIFEMSTDVCNVNRKFEGNQLGLSCLKRGLQHGKRGSLRPNDDYEDECEVNS